MAIRLQSASNQHVVVADNAKLDITGALTVMCRCKAASFAAFNELVGKWYDDGAFNVRTGYLLQITTGANVVGYALKDTYANRYYRIGNTTLSTNTWYHLAYTFTPSDAIRIYINGVEETSYSTTGTCPATIGTNSVPLLLGRLDTNGTPVRYSNVTLQDVRVYNKALTIDQIKTIHAGKGLDTITDGLVLRLLITGPEGGTASGADTVRDMINGLHGTPYGGAIYEAGAVALAG